jgi:hypothetical protein
VSSIIVEPRVRTEPGKDINRSRAVGIVVEADEEIGWAKSLIGENIEISPALKRWAGG